MRCGPATLVPKHGVARFITALLGSHDDKVRIPFLVGAISTWMALNQSGES